MDTKITIEISGIKYELQETYSSEKNKIKYKSYETLPVGSVRYINETLFKVTKMDYGLIETCFGFKRKYYVIWESVEDQDLDKFYGELLKRYKRNK